MRKVHFILRTLGYASGLIGLLLLVAGRNVSGVPESLTAVGASLLIVMFVAFAVSYFVYFMFLMRK